MNSTRAGIPVDTSSAITDDTVLTVDLTYSSEDFEGGTVGAGTLAAAFTGTDYVAAGAFGAVDIIAHIASTGGPGAGIDPTGQHAKVSKDTANHFTLAVPMTLATDNVTAIDINFAVYMKNQQNNTSQLLYSALGDFSDQVQIQVFTPAAIADIPNYTYEASRWYAGQSVTINSTDPGITFTDTAKIRWAPVSGHNNDHLYLDDIIISGVFPPTLAGTDIVDDKSGGPIFVGEQVTYTVTFSKDMDETTVDAADFSNAGTSAVTIDTITETTPGMFTVQATTTGTLQLQVSAAAVLADADGNALDTVAAISDDTNITVNAANVAPTWVTNSVNEVAAAEGTVYSAMLGDDASDANSDPLTYAKASGPLWFSVAADGTLSGTPANSDVGANEFTVSVSDGIAAPVEATLNITVRESYTTWISKTFENSFSDTSPSSNPDGDSINNLLEFAFGTDPTLSDSGSLVVDGSVNGQPLLVPSGGGGSTCDLHFVRRDDHSTFGSLTYTPQFSSDLVTYYDSVDPPTLVADSTDDADYEVVKVPFPTGDLPDGEKARFGRIDVTETP